MMRFFPPLILLCSACHHRAGIPDQPVNRILVVDSEVTEEIKTQTREVKGWWFGARDIYRNPNSGEIFSDILAKRLASDTGSLEAYPRTDFRYYKANKKDRLKKAFPHLGDKAIEVVFSRISYCDFARDLDIDKVIVARLNRCYSTHNRTFHFWTSVIEIEVSILDARTKQAEWTSHIYSRKFFQSSYSAMEKVAREIIHDLKKEYLYRKKEWITESG
ncbi:hypothetical protein JW926_11150 [Candidatus Sumerlaeota bacterium]|nr:hypothetical protein [Candidatus Sumerlaeota bacterium]